MKNIRKKIALIFLVTLFSSVFAQAAKLDKKEEDSYYVAVKAFEDGFYDVALALFDKFLSTYMNSDKTVDAMIYVGQCYFFQEKYIKALDQFEMLYKSEQAQKVKDKVLFWLGEVYAKGRDYKHACVYYQDLIENYKDSYYLLPAYKALALAEFNNGDFNKALSTYRKILSQFKNDLITEDVFFGIVETLYRMKDYAQLKNELTFFVEKYPSSSMLSHVYFYLGEANFYLGEYQEAVDAYKKALSSGALDKEADLANLGIGWTYLKLKQFDEASAIFSRFKEDDSNPSVLLGKAVLEAGLGSFDKAISLFDRVIAEDKSGEYTTFAYFAKGEVLYHLSRFNEAIVSYRTSLDKLKIASGLYTDVSELRDKIYYGLAWSYLKVGDFQAAQEAFHKVASLSSDKIVKLSAMVQLADTYQDAGDYKKAIGAYQEFLTNYPDSVYNDYIQYQLGITWLKMDDLDSAVLAFRKLLKDYPDSQMHDDACYFLGLAYFRKSDYEGAKKELEKFLSGYKDSSYRYEAVYLLGESLSSLGEFKAALEAFNVVSSEAALQDPVRQKAEYEIASVYAQMGNDNEANKRLADFLLRYPDSQLSPDILFWLGQSYSTKKNFVLSRKYLERLIRNYPDHELVSDAFLEIGLSYLAEQNVDLAIRNLEKVGENSRGSSAARAYILLGDLYLSRSDLSKALENYKKVLSLGESTSKAAYVKMSAVYKIRKNYQEAIDVLEKALLLEGPESNAEIQLGIAESYEDAGRIDDAIEAYLKIYYLYPKEINCVAKALLRVSKIYEDKQDWKNFALCLDKISKLDVPQAKYARERLGQINNSVK